MPTIRITWPRGEVTAHLEATPTAQKLFAALPCESSARTWGEEVYFELPVMVKLESDARQVVDPGTVCFWVQGSSLALPYGPTPASKGKECRLVTAVNVLGKLAGDARALSSVRDGDAIKVERVEA
ncbi:MAG TPA: cyclophilin-like fold protein [Burkholderiales bacterium]|nr:cyclophilin-like fold protein [Burkholderiales bacterium]